MTSGWLRAQIGAFQLNTAWEVQPGRVLVLFGPSGAGKTQTLRGIAGLLTPLEGHIEVGGVVVFDHAKDIDVPPHRRQVGYVPQDWLLFPHLDVRQNIAYGLGAMTAGAKATRVAGLVERLGLAGLERRRTWELSGGQQQRVSLARALAPNPAVLLLDEPFSSLDLDIRRQVRGEVLTVLRGAQVPVVLVTHDREEALAMGDEVLVLEQGRVIAHGEPLAVLGHPPQERVARLTGVENLLRLRVEGVAPAEGTMTCRSGPFILQVPLADAQPGDEITIGLRADDVLLASAEPVGLSARNVLAGQVTGVTAVGALVEVAMDCAGTAMKSHVTRGAVVALRIAPGMTLWAVVKASSCVVLRE